MITLLCVWILCIIYVAGVILHCSDEGHELETHKVILGVLFAPFTILIALIKQK